MTESGPRLATTGATFDPTILTVFIPGTEFIPYQGSSLESDLVRYESPDSNCVSADPGAGGVLTELRAGVDVPDGSRIRRIVFYGVDSDGSEDIGIRLSRGTINVPTVGAPTRTFTGVDAFSTSGAPGVVALAGAGALNSLAGTVPTVGGVDHHFHTIHVQVWNSSSANHKLCGVEVEYQVPDGVTVTGRDARISVTATGPEAARGLFTMVNNGRAFFKIQDTTKNDGWQFGTRGTGFEINRVGSGGSEFRFFENGKVTMGPGATINFDLSPTGDLKVAGSITDGSGKTLGALTAENEALRKQVAALEARLAAIEEVLAQPTGG